MRLVRLLLVVLLLFSALFFGALVRSRSWGKHFRSIKVGDAESAVRERAGEPARHMRCSALPEVPEGCRDVLVYPGPLASVMPEFWLVPLDASGHVVRVLHTTRAD